MDTNIQNNLKGYELIERIGAGGFGAVYRAIQTTIGREVAVKIILPDFANQPEFIRRFEGEAQLVARLEHPHITPLYDYWRDPQGAYLVMRWLRGGSLYDMLQQGPLELSAAALLLDQIAGALSLAHRNSVIHRDIKPGNILLDEDGNAYLTDFGIAKDLNLPQHHTQPDAIIGSLDYIAPEQARSETVTPRTDIYSLGVTLYEVITGEHPFPNASTVERLYRHIHDPLPEISVLDAAVAAKVNQVIQKATAKNPDQRYSDALTFAADFREAIGFDQVLTNVVELLTPREQEILQLIIEGLSNKDIAQRLTVALSTVKWYINQIYHKLGVRSRVQAIVRARELDLIVKHGEPLKPLPVRTEDFHPENPYKGLRAFQSADYQDFFGREQVTAKLVKRLSETGEYHRFLAVIGPSGSGKSSLVKAGLIPALWRGDLSGSEKWFVVEMLPGSRPLDELEIALTKVAANHAGNLREQLQRDQYGLVRVASLILPDDDSELILIIDQFEEVFTLLEDKDARVHFLDLLHAAVTEPNSRVRVVITLRADFYDRPLHYPQIGEPVRSRLETILPLSAEELERAISGPAGRVGVTFEPGLVSAMIADVNDQPGALPLLQYALTELFEQRQGRILTHAAYQTIGGTVGALAKRAEEVYLNLNESEQEITRQMFLRLVTLGEGTEDTRRRTARSELLAIATDTDAIDDIIDTFAGYRLFSLDTEPVTHSPTVEVAHEALLREWERLRAWLNESRDEIKLQRQLSTLAAEWQSVNRDSGYLISDTRLALFEAWAQVTSTALTASEREYLNASLEQRAERQRIEAIRKAHEATLERRSRQTLRALAAVFGVAAVIAMLLSFFAFDKSRQAQNNAGTATVAQGQSVIDAQNAENAQATSDSNVKTAEAALETATIAQGFAFNQLATSEHRAIELESQVLSGRARQLLTDGFPDEALALVLEAVRLDPSGQAQRTLADMAFAPGTMRRYEGWQSAIFSPDGQMMLVAEGDDLVLLTFPDEQRLLTLPGAAFINTTSLPGGVYLFNNPVPAIFTPDSKALLVYGPIRGRNETPMPKLVSIETGAEIQHYAGLTGSILSAVFSPDGQRFLAVTRDPDKRDYVEQAVMSLWETESGEMVQSFEQEDIWRTAPVIAVFSQDSSRIVTGGTNGAVSLWDVNSAQVIREYEGHEQYFLSGDVVESHVVNSVAFSADGQLILSGATDNTVRLWDTASGEQRQLYIGVYGVFGPADATVLTADGNHMTLWNTEKGSVLREYHGHSAIIRQMMLSPDDKYILSSADEVRLWRFAPGNEILAVPGTRGVLTPDGTRLVTITDNQLILWDVASGKQIRTIEADQPDGIMSLAVSPDGHRVLSGSSVNIFAESHVVLSDLDSGEQIRVMTASPGGISSLDFAPQTSLMESIEFGPNYALATELNTGILLIFDLDTGEVAYRDENSGRYSIMQASFENMGVTIYMLDPYGIQLWDTLNKGSVHLGNPPYGFDRIESYDVTSSIPPDLLLGVHDQSDGADRVVLWDLSVGKVAQEYRGHTGYITDVAFSPDDSLILSSSADSTIRLWDKDGGTEIRRFEGHIGAVRDIAFSEDGQMIVSSGDDNTVRVWRVIGDLTALTTWTLDNRYVPEISCAERELSNMQPLCTEEGIVPTVTPTSAMLIVPTPTPTLAPAEVYGVMRWNDEPLPGIHIALMREEGSGTESETVTDAEGYYRLQAPDGIYRLSVNATDTVEPYTVFYSGRPFELVAGQVMEQNYDMVKRDLSVTLPHIDSTVETIPTFEWEAYPGAVSYKVSLFRHQPSYEATLYDVEVETTQLISPVALEPDGVYSGWVYAVNANGTSIASGDIPSIHVRGVTPAEIHGILRWNDEPLPGVHVGLLPADTLSGPALVEAVTDTEGRYRLETVSGFYRLEVNTKDTVEPYDAFVSGRPFELSGGEVMEQNYDVKKRDLRVTLPNRDNPIETLPVFEWEAYPGAVSYAVSLYRHEPSYEVTLEEIPVEITRLVSPVELVPNGLYGGWVYALNANGTSIAYGDIERFRVGGTATDSSRLSTWTPTVTLASPTPTEAP